MWHTPVECVSFIPYNGAIIINVLHKSYKDTKQYTLKIKMINGIKVEVLA